MADPQSLLELREQAFGADLAVLGERLGAFSSSDLAQPALREIQGVAKYRGGDVPAAVSLISEAVSAPRHVAHFKSLLFLMRGQFSTGDIDGALMTARRVIDADSGNQEALRLAGGIYSQRQDWDRADRFWRQLCEIAPGEPEAALQVARIGGRRGEWATQAFYADVALRAAPSHAEALRLAIDGRLKLRRLDGLGELLPPLYQAERDLAALLFRAARRLSPNPRDATAGFQRLSRTAATTLFEALAAGDEAAVAPGHAQGVAEIDPATEEAWFSMGRLRLASDPARAAVCFAHAAEHNRDDPWRMLNLGRAMERAERYVEAMEAYGAVVRLIADPANDWRAEAAKSMINSRQKLIGRGRDAFAAKRLEEAWADCAAAAGVGGDASDVEPMLTSIKRAMFLALRERFKNDDPDFIAAAENYLRLDPDHPEALLYAGRKLMVARGHARAREVWTRLAALEPAEAHYQLQIARCCAWLKLRQEGAAAAAAALRLDPTLAEAAKLEKQFAQA